MKSIVGVVILSAFLGIFSGWPAASHAESEQAAVTSAKKWLKLVDEGNYSQSWDQAAPYFQGAVSKEAWQTTLAGVRKPLGVVISRDLKSKQYTTSLPGAPDGQYVVIQFNTSFANKKTAIETVTPMLDQDGQWRVSGYYIQ